MDANAIATDSSSTSSAKYFDTLPPIHKRRYSEKILDIDGVDPYEIPKRSWSVNPDDLPELRYPHIVNYFVLGKSAYTCDQFKAYKSLNSYKSFTAGWVRDISTYKPGGCENCVVSAKVLHSQRLNEKPLTPWLIWSASEECIASAHCTCMAGLGETCTHVGALAFAIDAFVSAREQVTCTGTKAYWKVPCGVKGVTPKPACDIDFSSAKERKSRLDSYIVDNDSVTLPVCKQKGLFPVPVPQEEELADLFQQLSGISSSSSLSSNVLKVVPEFCSQFRVPEDPISLRSLHQEQCVGMSLAELQERCMESSSTSISISLDDSVRVEESTREQRECKLWYAARAGRITASNLHSVCHTSCEQPSISLINRVCYPDKSKFTSVYTDWGIKNEDKARETYLKLVENDHVDFNLRQAGFHVPVEYPFMGASPDGIVTCECHGVGCLEIKCPFVYRDSSVEDAICDAKFCLQRTEDGKLELKHSHQYYSQVQAQLFLTKSAYCDFAVWTTVDMVIVRIFPNKGFWEECVEKASKFFKLFVLPELVGKWTKLPPQNPNKRALADSDTESEESGNKKYCVCGEGEHGKMVGCDNPGCAMEWFHFECVGITVAPKGKKKWYCPRCAQSVSTSKKQKP